MSTSINQLKSSKIDELIESTNNFHHLLISRVINKSKLSSNNENDNIVFEKLRKLWESKLENVLRSNESSINNSIKPKNFVESLLDGDLIIKKQKTSNTNNEEEEKDGEEETENNEVELFPTFYNNNYSERKKKKIRNEQNKLLKNFSNNLPLVKNYYNIYKTPKKMLKIKTNRYENFSNYFDNIDNIDINNFNFFFRSYFDTYSIFLDNNKRIETYENLIVKEKSNKEITLRPTILQQSSQLLSSEENHIDQVEYGFSELFNKKPSDLIIGMKVFILFTPYNKILSTREMNEKLKNDVQFNLYDYKLFEGVINSFILSGTDQNIQLYNNIDINQSQKKIKGLKIRLTNLLSYYKVSSEFNSLLPIIPDNPLLCSGSETIIHWPTYRLLIKRNQLKNNLNIDPFLRKDIEFNIDEFSSPQIIEDNNSIENINYENIDDLISKNVNNQESTSQIIEEENHSEDDEDETTRLYREYLARLDENTENSQSIAKDVTENSTQSTNNNTSNNNLESLPMIEVSSQSNTSSIYTLITGEEVYSDVLEEIEKSIIIKPKFKICSSVSTQLPSQKLDPEDDPSIKIKPKHLILCNFIKLRKTQQKWIILLQELYIINIENKSKSFILPSLKLTINHSDSDLLYNQIESKYYDELIFLSRKNF